MPAEWVYRRPAVDARVIMATAVPAAAEAGAHTLLEHANQNVPVEQGVLKASGRVAVEGTRVAVTYGRDDDGGGTHAPSNQYAVIQHEDLELNHPNGGGAKWLESAAHSDGEAVLEAMAALLRKALM